MGNLLKDEIQNFSCSFSVRRLFRIKVRPAICLTRPIGNYNHVVIAFITSQIPKSLNKSDIVVEKGIKNFAKTGLKVSSTIRLHRLITIPADIIKRELGKVSNEIEKEIKQKLKGLFELNR